MPKLRGHWQHRQEEVSELCRHGFILAALAPSSSLGRCQQGGSVRYKLTAFYQCLIDCSTTGSRWSCSGGFYGFSSFVVGTTRVSFTAAEGDLESTSELTSQCGSKSRCQITTSVTIFAEFMLKSFFFILIEGIPVGAAMLLWLIDYWKPKVSPTLKWPTFSFGFSDYCGSSDEPNVNSLNIHSSIVLKEWVFYLKMWEIFTGFKKLILDQIQKKR